MQARTKRIWVALLLGPLAVLPTAVIGLVAVLPLAAFSAVVAMDSGSGTWLFNTGLVLLALAGSGIVALISYRILRSRGLVALTLGAALTTQAIAAVWWEGVEKREVARTRAEWVSLGASLNRTVQHYAALGIPHYEVSEPLDRTRDNHHPELGPIYGRLTFKIPVTVHETGIYHLRLRYRAGPDPVEFHTGLLESIDSLGVGQHEISVQFALREQDYPGLWSPASMGGRATAELYVKVDQAKLVRSYVPETKELARLRSKLVREVESGADVLPWREMGVDSVVTDLPGGVRYPENSRWGPVPKPSRLTDRQEEELRRRGSEPKTR